jgi:GNAT superfamily N-acetyltransferase
MPVPVRKHPRRTRSQWRPQDYKRFGKEFTIVVKDYDDSWWKELTVYDSKGREIGHANMNFNLTYKQTCELQQIFLGRRARGLGLGRFLTLEIMQMAKDYGCPVLIGEISNPRQAKIRAKFPGTHFSTADLGTEMTFKEVLDNFKGYGRNYLGAPRVFACTPLFGDTCPVHMEDNTERHRRYWAEPGTPID